MTQPWEVEYTDELGDWWADLTQAEQESIDASVRLLEARGPNLGYPHTSASGVPGIRTCVSFVCNMRDALPAAYAFDPRRCAILLIGGDKTGDGRWYEVHVPIADRLYDTHLETLQKEGRIDGQEIQ